MKIYRSILLVLLVFATWLTLSLGMPSGIALDSYRQDSDAPQIQKNAAKLDSLRTQLLGLQPLIENRSWNEVQSYVRGPLGDLEIRLSFLKNSSSLPSEVKSSVNANQVSRSLSTLDSSARAGNYQRSVDSFQVLMDEFNELFSWADAVNVPSSKDSRLTNAPVVENLRNSSRNIPTVETRNTPKVGKDLGLTNSAEKNLQPNNPSDNKINSYTKENKGQENMDEAFSPDLTYLALVCLIPLMVYLQIRHQRSNQEYQTKVSELEGKIETLNQDKAELGSALEETQGRLVGMFMNLEETKPVARLTQKRAVTVEEQEERINANAPFVKALLKQADQASFEEDEI